MQAHQLSIGGAMDAVTEFINHKPVPERNGYWIQFLSALHRHMDMWVDHQPRPENVLHAMEAIGIHTSDFIEPTRMA